MARQRTYAVDQEIHAGDQWLITDVADNGTKNITVANLAKFFAQTGVADPNRIGFHYTHTGAGTIAAGQFRYEHATTTLAPGNVTGMQVHRYTNRGVDFAPITHLLEGVDIKITDITDSTNTNYAIYSVGNYTPDTNSDIITIPLTLRAAAGTLPQGSTVLTTIGNHSNSFTGGVIREGLEDPNGNLAGQAGDVYFHLRPDVQELDVYGPLRVPNVGPDYDWGDAIQLKGVEGEAITRVEGHDVFDAGVRTGTDLEFFVGEGALQTAIEERIFIPIGPAGLDGDTIAVQETIVGTSTTDGELTITVTDPNPGGGSTQTTATIPHGHAGASVVIVSDEEVEIAGTEYLRVHYTIGGVAGMFDIPLAADGNHGRGIDRIYSESIGGTPEMFEIYVDYVNPVSTRNLIGTLSNGTDGMEGTAGDTVVFTETTTGDETTDGNLRVVVTHADSTTTTENITIPHGAPGPTLEVDGDNATILNFTGAGVSTIVSAGTATVTIDDELPTTADTRDLLSWNGSTWEAQTFSVTDLGDVHTPLDGINEIRFAGTGVDIESGGTGIALVTIQGGGHPDVPVLTPRLTAPNAHQANAATNTWSITFSSNTADFAVIDVELDSNNADFVVTPTIPSPANTTWGVNHGTGIGTGRITATVRYTENGDSTIHTSTTAHVDLSVYAPSFWDIQSDANAIVLPGASTSFELDSSSETITITAADVDNYLGIYVPDGEIPLISTHPDGTPYTLDPPTTVSYLGEDYDYYNLRITAGVNLYIKQ